jgi:hypothetical protein
MAKPDTKEQAWALSTHRCLKHRCLQKALPCFHQGDEVIKPTNENPGPPQTPMTGCSELPAQCYLPCRAALGLS